MFEFEYDRVPSKDSLLWKYGSFFILPGTTVKICFGNDTNSS